MADKPVEKQWICSRCSNAKGLDGLGRRARFPHEKCPLCEDPGVGMVLVPVEIQQKPD